MIIFGYRGMVKLLGMVTLICQRCGNPAAHRVIKRSRWFTLFFIPIFPISMSRAMTCTFCGTGTKLSKEQAEQILGTAAPQQQPIGPSAEQIAPPVQGQPYPAQQGQPYPAQQPDLRKVDPAPNPAPQQGSAQPPAPRPMPPAAPEGPAAS